MDAAIRGFRQAAARQNRGRHGLQRRYSPALQAQAVAYCAAQQRAGIGVREVATALGVGTWSLYRWRRTGDAPGRFHTVRIARPVPSAPAPVAPVVIIGADSLRIEGLDLAAAAHLVGLLR